MTFWNLSFAKGRGFPQAPDCDFGALLNFVGRYQPPLQYDALDLSEQVETWPKWCPPQRWYAEQVPWGRTLYPPDLYAAMVATKRQRLRL